MENSANWLEVVTAIGAIATPILVLILSGIGWRIRAGLDRQFQLEDKLRDDRIETYNDILELKSCAKKAVLPVKAYQH